MIHQKPIDSGCRSRKNMASENVRYLLSHPVYTEEAVTWIRTHSDWLDLPLYLVTMMQPTQNDINSLLLIINIMADSENEIY